MSQHGGIHEDWLALHNACFDKQAAALMHDSLGFFFYNGKCV